MRVTLVLILAVLTVSSCGQNSASFKYVEDPQTILKNQDNFLNYYNTYLKLSQNFIAYDTNEKIITRENFLSETSSGIYLPLRLNSNDTPKYKLYKMDNTTDGLLRSLIANAGALEYKYYQMEGKPISEFDFEDLEGNHYNNETIAGKIVIFKFWFIQCVQCVKEMPELNKVVDSYKGRNDILFISLALDKKEDLIKFLKKVKFKYSIVAEQREYLLNNLGITLFPTHVVINKKGQVVKVVNSYEEMLPILQNEAKK
jgi:thiol-disulfide isomerase/thioredoxin